MRLVFFIDLAFNVANLTLSVLRVLGPGLRLMSGSGYMIWITFQITWIGVIVYLMKLCGTIFIYCIILDLPS